MHISLRKTFVVLASVALVLPVVGLFQAPKAKAAANMYVTASSPVRVNDTISITINVNTNGQSANAFDANFSYPTSMFDPVRGSTTGSICNLWITQPEPSGGSASISCGKPGGYTGTGLLATIYLSAKKDGEATFGLSGCSVLANDGAGTDITGGCSGKTITVNPQSATATPPPTTPPATTPPATIYPSNTPKPKTTPKPPATPGVIGNQVTPPPAGTAVPGEDPNSAPATEVPTAPPEQTLGETATPSDSGTTGEESETTQTDQKRSISGAFKDIFASFKELGSMKKDATSAIALVLTGIPFLALMFGITFLIYRLYLLEKRRRRTLDRLFEMELSELASLEGKMDLLAEKGQKGREMYREEFQKAKENILRQLKPEYGKPVDTISKPAEEAKDGEPPANPPAA